MEVRTGRHSVDGPGGGRGTLMHERWSGVGGMLEASLRCSCLILASFSQPQMTRIMTPLFVHTGLPPEAKVWKVILIEESMRNEIPYNFQVFYFVVSP